MISGSLLKVTGFEPAKRAEFAGDRGRLWWMLNFRFSISTVILAGVHRWMTWPAAERAD